MKKESKLTDLMALMVLLVFALCILMVLLTGTRVYKRLLDNGDAAFTSRMFVRYITTRLHQAESVALEDFEGCAALSIPEEIDGERYRTYVYWHDGYIRELFCVEGAGLYPEDGERVLETQPMEITLEDDLLTVQMGAEQLCLYLPAEKEVAL